MCARVCALRRPAGIFPGRELCFLDTSERKTERVHPTNSFLQVGVDSRVLNAVVYRFEDVAFLVIGVTYGLPQPYLIRGFSTAL